MMILSPAIAERGGDGVDRQLDSFAHSRIVLARAMPLQELDLQQIQWIDVGQAQAYRCIQYWVLLEKARLLRDAEEAVVSGRPRVADAVENTLAQRAILDQR